MFYGVDTDLGSDLELPIVFYGVDTDLGSDLELPFVFYGVDTDLGSDLELVVFLEQRFGLGEILSDVRVS